MLSSKTNGLWHALDENSYGWGEYRIYRSIQGWTCWLYGEHSRRVGNAELMSKAMELAKQDAVQHET